MNTDVSTTTKFRTGARAVDDPIHKMIGVLRKVGAHELIREEGFCEVSCRSITTLIRAIHDDFSHLLDLGTPEERGMLRLPETAYKKDGIGEDIDCGLLNQRSGKRKPDPTAFEIAEGRLFEDRKDIFHARFGMLADYLRETYPQEWMQLITKYWVLIRGSEELNERSMLIARAFGALCDEMNTLRDPSLRYPGSLAQRLLFGHAVTRLLRYDMVGGSAHAKVHSDRSCLTIHHDSSHQGLVIFDHKKAPHRVRETDPKTRLLFPGIKFWIVTRGMWGMGTKHGVRAEHVSSAHRDATVTFVNCAHTPDDIAWYQVHKNELAFDPSEFPLA